MRTQPISGDRFAEIVNMLRDESPLHAENVDHVTPDESAAYFVTDDQRSGYAITGDQRLIAVWSVERGRGDMLVADAVQHGARTLDCFEGHLSDLYARHGFEIVDRVANWDPEGPAVVEMRRP